MEQFQKEDIIAHNKVLTVCAYGKTTKEVIDHYQNWAGDYEEDLKPYKGPEFTAEAIAELFPTNKTPIKILDVAAGTGLLAEKLYRLGFENIDALDASKAMLDEAKKKNIYKHFYCEFISTKQLPINEDTYDCIACVGGFGQCHIPVEAIYEMIRIVKPGGSIVIALREDYLDLPEYSSKLEPFMKTLEDQGKWQKLTRKILHNYCFDKTGVLYIYTVL